MQIMCPKLGQLVCGSYGLFIGRMDICSEKEQYVVKMETELNFEFWSTDSSHPNIECYIWCDTKQDFKAKQSLIVSENFLDSQLKGASVNNFFMESHNSYLTSPYKVYSITKNQICSDENSPCESTSTFLWKRNTICQVRKHQFWSF